MKINQLDSKPSLTRKQLTNNCYYRFTKLPGYIFIFSKECPNDIIPLINNESELKEDYNNFKRTVLEHEPIECLTIDNLSFSQTITSLENLKQPYIPISDLHCEIKKSLSSHRNLFTKDKRFLLLKSPTVEYIYMYYPISTLDILYFNITSNDPWNDNMIASNIAKNHQMIAKQITINHIDFRVKDHKQ